VTSLTCCRDEYVAVGLQDGGILVWDDLREQPVELRRHIGRVQEVVANPDPDSDLLISRGGGDRILVWHLREPETEPQEIRRERHLFFRMTWQSGQPLAAVYVDDQLLLRGADGTMQPLPYSGDISMLRFSPNGQYLAALKRDQNGDAVDIRDLSTLTLGASIPHPGILQTLEISQDGKGLLTVVQDRLDGPHTVRLWNVEARQLDWELTASPPRPSGSSQPPAPQLRDCQGLSEVERAYWQSHGVVV
jgi:WD40 repeat protein